MPSNSNSLEDCPLANTRSAEKAIRVSDRNRTSNRIVRTTARTQVRKAVAAIETAEVAASEQSVREAIRALDKAAEKGIIKKNNAARRKARLMQKLNRLRAQPKPA